MLSPTMRGKLQIGGSMMTKHHTVPNFSLPAKTNFVIEEFIEYGAIKKILIIER